MAAVTRCWLVAASLFWTIPSQDTTAMPPGTGVLQHERLVAGQSLTLETGTVHFASDTVLHIWINAADGVTPIGSPWWAWGQDAKTLTIPPFTIHGPAHVFLLYVNPTMGPRALYYSILWTRRP